MAKAGRKQKPYETSWGEIVPGLARQGNDNRWRITATGFRFTEPDERLAVKRFRELTPPTAEVVQIPIYDAAGVTANADVNAVLAGKTEMVIDPADPDAPAKIVRNVHSAAVWAWFRDQLLNHAEHAAKMTGLPELANWKTMAVPSKSMTIASITKNYRDKGGATDKAKQEATKPLERLAEHAGAKTLADLTLDKLNAWRMQIEKTIPGPATRRAYYSRVRSVVAFGLKTGLDARQIREFLDRAAVLWTAAALPNHEPNPISPDDFRKLLETAGDGPWRAWLLCGLNCCLHLGEVCALKWSDFDLDGGTHVAIREKTKRKRIPRAAVLWPETIAELKKLKRRGDYLFTSTHGTRFNRNTRGNDFRELRIKAGLGDDITFDTLRDGAYTAAIRGQADERRAKVLAGHSCGMSDAYVLRSPEFVKPATDAVYAAYAPLT